MEGEQFLLRDGLDGDGVNAIGPHGIEQACRVGAVGLLSTDKRSHILRRQERHAMAAGLSGSPPEMCGATGLHDDVGRWLLLEEALKLGAGETAPTGHPAGSIGFGDFEHVLGQIHSNRRSIHSGLLLEVN
jgi:hypothetical protein